jgi:hypothetical protein
MDFIGKISAVTIIAAMAFCSAFAQHDDAGSTNYPHLLINYNARSAGMAGASVALPSGVNGSIDNPAAAANVGHQQGFVGYQLVLDGVMAAGLAYAYPVKGIGTFSGMLLALTSGNVPVIEMGLDGEPDSTGANARDDYFTPGVSFGRSFLDSRLNVGITVKGLYHRIAVPSAIYSSKGIACDFGVQYRVLSDRFIIAAVVRNAGGEFASFSGTGSLPVPTLFEAGFSYVPERLPAVRIAADVNKIRGDYVNVEPGLELEIYPDVLYGRIGFLFSQRDLSEQLHKFTGTQEEGYTKSNWTTLTTGIGLNTKIRDVAFHVDFALPFRIDWLPPSPILSVVVEF